jgi:hypothetical protein
MSEYIFSKSLRKKTNSDFVKKCEKTRIFYIRIFKLPTEFKKIANHKPFLEATLYTRFSNATLGGSTIHRGKGL